MKRKKPKMLGWIVIGPHDTVYTNNDSPFRTRADAEQLLTDWGIPEDKGFRVCKLVEG